MKIKKTLSKLVSFDDRESKEKKAEDILVLLFNNLVSPIHLIDVVGEYSDLCVNDFGF